MTRILICGALALCGCVAASGEPGIQYSHCDPLQVLADADASGPEVESISAAIALWREAGVTNMTTTAQEGGAQVPVRFASSSPMYRGVYEPSLGVVSINRELDGIDRDITVAHELGHALGLPHVPIKERLSVMNPGNLTVRPSLDDYAELERLWSCPSQP